MTGSAKYAGLASREAKLAAIEAANNGATLDAMWTTWEAQGFSPEGMIHGAVLQRKRDLGLELSPQDESLLSRIQQQVAHGQSLPPIRGAMKGVGQ